MFCIMFVPIFQYVSELYYYNISVDISSIIFQYGTILLTILALIFIIIDIKNNIRTFFKATKKSNNLAE